MKALIIGSGVFSKKALDFLGDDEYYTICADGGYDHAKKENIIPDILLGDLDSIKGESDVKTITFPKEKDETDSELALLYALENGYKDIVLTGVTGTRLDHTLANILLLKKVSDAGAKAVIADDNNEIYYTEAELALNGKKGEFLSLIPVLGDALVSICGVKYPLENEKLEYGKTRGISNEFSDEKCVIKVHKGSVIVIKSND